ncbi:DUF1801 domain-containing protein [Parasegetibacter sp. NRK P23]|uniref:DUF1801 domain-containing protein n=1 Tax=Parasegetibacter sp. NRK P23 TaxID=2942999 RepID=UPI0020449D23|nr:DUF1801 domain-containing protein [Parasegetibacter sp. NRK P23]MCM5528001.1 DUF1801 domain-containing protein [Parasegetibacter sp. NRK P23]
MSEAKTKPTQASAKEFLALIQEEDKRKDCLKICAWMEEWTGLPPVMWGDAMVGFGKYHYKYASGHEGDCFRCGFSPRKQNISLYVTMGFEHIQDLLKQLGKVKTGKACIYIKKLEDINGEVLKAIIARNFERMKQYDWVTELE